MPAAIVVEGVWKRFHRGERHDSLRDLIPALVRRLAGRAPDAAALHEGDFWAVQDVGFTVQPGQAFGIIGPNGAGKSTMLKLLTRILKPTRGAVAHRGRVAALIEVAAGFHQDLTGRENIFLQGAIMGLRRHEIAARLESIVEFSGISPFIDTPVKRYSSGMNARLGFAIAAHLDPDVLVIDEVLAVGDMPFQQKCVERMKAFKQSGVAIVFVSHNLQAIADLCDEAIFLKSSVQAQGPVLDAISAFLHSMQSEGSMARADVEIDSVRLMTADGAPASSVVPGTPLLLDVRYAIKKPLAVPTFALTVRRSTDDLLVYDGNFSAQDMGITNLDAGSVHRARFTLRAHLTRGQYQIGLNVYEGSAARTVGLKSLAALFQVAETRTQRGVADLGATVTPV